MDNPPPKNCLAERLLQQDTDSNDRQYKDYRMQLEIALKTAEQREKIVSWIVAVSLITSLAGMFAGGSRVFGAFDPWDKDATILSVSLGVIYVIAVIIFWFSLASYFSRFRPRVSKVKEEIRDAKIELLQQEIFELKQLLKTLSSREPTENK